MATYLFFRRNYAGNLTFYPIEGIERDDQVINHVVLNPGTVKVTDFTGKRIVWQEGAVVDEPPPELDTTNKFQVSANSAGIVIMRPPRSLSFDDALNLAAWLVALADRDDKFSKLLEAVKST